MFRIGQGIPIGRVPLNIFSSPITSNQETALLTEATIEKMFRTLMNDPNRSDESFDKAEELLEDELRAESPLRHRLTVELEELRTAAAKS
ncbi:hypothetical protein SH528x_002916 [Novipirellula sp. SH528]|uniref:hypothetical protein n=1 Tax=Novipirellula sp. SH528 TaxID=3454466 RepID=UPI003FA15D36